MDILVMELAHKISKVTINKVYSGMETPTHGRMIANTTPVMTASFSLTELQGWRGARAM